MIDQAARGILWGIMRDNPNLSEEARAEQVETFLNDFYRKCARDAIEAIREPTEAMIEIAMSPYRYGNDEMMNAAFRKTIAGYWKAMIDEILK